MADAQEEEGARGQERQDGQISMEEVSGDGGGGGGEEGEGDEERSHNNSFSKYMSLGGGSEEVAFKWNFISSKLAELKTKTN